VQLVGNAHQSLPPSRDEDKVVALRRQLSRKGGSDPA
jgi:hypothetical protein